MALLILTYSVWHSAPSLQPTGHTHTHTHMHRHSHTHTHTSVQQKEPSTAVPALILTDFVQHSTLGHLKIEIHTNKYSKGNIKGWDLANSGLLCVVFSPKPPENRNTHQQVQQRKHQGLGPCQFLPTLCSVQPQAS